MEYNATSRGLVIAGVVAIAAILIMLASCHHVDLADEVKAAKRGEA